MFTGIIEQLGTLQSIDGNRYTIEHDYTEPFEIGESIALSGMCTTVIEIGEQHFTVEIIAESRDRTTFDAVQAGDLVNLERAARVGQRNSGHHVTGHIDEVGEILKLEKKDDFWLFRVSFSQKNRPLVVEKGSVALDGISLTVSAVGDDWLEVSIISHTLEVTNLKHKKVGDGVNVEFDILGKYREQRARE